VMEKVSGLQLHWYLRYWINTTKRIDYGIGSVVGVENETLMDLNRIGEFPMPIDLLVTYKDGKKEIIYIPLNELLGGKANDNPSVSFTTVEAWPWVNPTYTVKISRKASDIESIEIDPSLRLADVNRKNNKVVLADLKAYTNPTK
jgi:hypothetical protein